MKIQVIPVAQLSADYLSVWSRLQRSEASLASPFFRPEFALAVAAERADVEVVVWEQAGEPVGFLPFERSSRHAGRAVGYYINLFQGAIARADVSFSPREVLRAAGLRGWRFNHVAAAQRAFAPYQYVVASSPYLDVSRGFEHYRTSRGKSAAVFLSHILQKERKGTRELGEVRLDVNSADKNVLKQLIGWKIDQCRRTQVPCVFSRNWLVRLHERLLDYATDDFAGTMFSLRIGGRLAAAFFCLRSGRVLQGSILGYDRNLRQFAPGLVLLKRVAQIADSLGVTRIDLGSGGESYKNKLASAYDQVGEGAVLSQPLLAPLYRGWFRAKDRLRATRLISPVRPVRAWMRYLW